MDPAIRVIDVSKQYAIGGLRRHDTVRDVIVDRIQSPLRGRARSQGEQIWALRNVSLEIVPGEVVGIIGRNGAGKSTLLKILARITSPTKGRVEIRGLVGSLLEVGTGFHPELSGRENIFLNGAILGMSQAEIRRKFDDIVSFAEVERFIDTPIKRYSSGMSVRLAFSVAAHFEPEVLLVDEVLSVGDQEFQRRCLGRVREISQGGRTVLFVSHNLAAVSSLCTRAYFLQEGRIRAEGHVADVLDRYAASMREQSVTTLVERRDRIGNGHMRFTAVAVEGPTGPVRVGESALFALEYAATETHSGASVGFTVFGPLGERLFQCKSDLTGKRFTIPRGVGRLICAIPELPLLPGTYSINIFASVGGDENILDWLQDAATFEIFESDYLGSGRLPATSYGHFVVRQTWQLEPERSPAIRPESASETSA